MTVDTRVGYRICIHGGWDQRSYYTGIHHNNLGDRPQPLFQPYRLHDGVWRSCSEFMPRTPVVFATRADADAAVDEIAKTRSVALARKLVIVDHDDEIVARVAPPRRLAQVEVPECLSCGSKAWRRVEDRIVCRICGCSEEA